MNLTSLIWMFLATFMIHDFEEIIIIESWMERNFDFLYKKAPRAMRSQVKGFYGIKSYQFCVAVALEFMVFVPVTWMAAEKVNDLLFVGFNLVLLLHVLTHIGQTVLLRKYTPGVVTAVFITFPYSVYLFHQMFLASILNWETLLLSLPAGAILVPLVLFGHNLGKKLLPSSV